MATATYTFATGVPNIQPAVYAVGTTTPDLNSDDTVTDSSGVLSLDLDVGDYYAQWSWDGDTHQTSGEVASPDTLGEVAASAGSGGSSAVGARIVHKAPFAFDTPGLVTGAVAVFTDGYEPAVGDILHNAWVEIDTAWDGSTPQIDFGQFGGGVGGWCNRIWQSIDATHADSSAQIFIPTLLSQSGSATIPSDLYSMVIANFGSAPGATDQRVLPAKFVDVSDPIKICVSTTGEVNGFDPESTQGAAVLYVETSTPT